MSPKSHAFLNSTYANHRRQLAREGEQLVLGALLLVLAARKWRSRPRGGDAPEMPKGTLSGQPFAREAKQELNKITLGSTVTVLNTQGGPENGDAGKRTRVRVGPFASRAEADKAAAKIRGLDLPAAILTL